MEEAAGAVVILNGAPRSGKTSLARALQDRLPDIWINLGVDTQQAMLPEGLRPGVGLRPGADRSELRPLIPRLYALLYAQIAMTARAGYNVVVDAGHYDADILRDCLNRLDGLTVRLVGVHCPLDAIMARRRASENGRYLVAPEGGQVPEPVLAWQALVHQPGMYDLELDTSLLSPEEGASRIAAMLEAGSTRPTALERLLT